MSTDTALARSLSGGSLALTSLDDLFRLAKAMADTGLYGSPALCLVKILAGKEMGFGPVASLMDVHVIPSEGGSKLTVGAHLRAAAIKRSSKYDYKVHERSDAAVEVEFLERQSDKLLSLGRLRYTLADAQAKGWTHTQSGKPKSPWAKTPANMLFARVMTDGYKTFCPDLSGGLLTYDADEFDSESVAPAVPAVNGQPQTSTEDTVIDHRAAALATTEAARMERYGPRRLSPEETALATQLAQGGADPNAPAPAAGPAAPATITAEQRQALVAIIQAKGRSTEDVQRMLVSRGLKLHRLDDLPQSLLNWAAAILTDGQVSATTLDKISALIEQTRTPLPAIHARLIERYGVDRLALLSTTQAQEVLKGFEAAIAKKQAAATASGV